MDSELRQRLAATADADPAQHSWSSSESRWRSFTYALAGIVYMLRFQANTRIMAAATVALLIAAWQADIDAPGWAVLILAAALVWIAEFINAAVEAATNIAAPEYHPLAKVAKDVAAGAVLLASLTALLVGALILAPPLLDKLSSGISPRQP
ncbi:MAG: diacylglycerol kinase family protein [Chloroflexi bacterium]|nr:diacylglycerol kinase family protein [Chloroflexota bacterium]